MTVEQIYTGCLAQGAYYIQSENEAAIIDPLREVTPYIKKAAKDNATIKYVFETHFHADFVSGHLDLAEKTGATIVYGPKAVTNFEAHIAHDGEEFQVGKLKIRAIHTPGHTLESTCYLIFDENNKEYALFSGDTLFIGDVGRPDLAQKSDLTMDDLAGMLYESLNQKIKTLPDHVLIYPAHGAGSACGKNMSKETFDTLGNQKEVNYALRAETKEQFIKEVTDGLAIPPAYFPQNVMMNKNGYESFDNIMTQSMKPLSPAAFVTLVEVSDALILDTRKDGDYALGSVPGSINIGLGGQFAPWVGALIEDVHQQIVLITEVGKEKETLTRLSRVGFDNVLGYLDGGFEAWKSDGRDVDVVHRITPDEFSNLYNTDIKVIDVRKVGEYSAEHVAKAYNRPLDVINDWFSTLDHKEHFFMHCAGGYRSMMAASILKSRGFTNFTEVAGGFTAIAKTNVPRTDFMCQSKMIAV